MFLALLIGSATAGAVYNAVRLPAEMVTRRQFDRDASCHPSGVEQVAAGACRIEPVQVVGDLQRRLGRGGPYFAMDVQAPDGSTEEVIASDALAEQVSQRGASVSRLVFRGTTVAYLSGSILDPTGDNPAAEVVSRELSILYCVLIGGLFGLLSWLRFRVHAQDYDS
ncbi:hypothetical protein [Silvibacterium acidisoli]|uniref:hypothetical protein n=1 Tax=Acidobacteriaceae bacterium ZG23-2 TaxID=2883246 RepID=UPI00406C35B2